MKTSKQKDQHSSPQNRKTYENVFRVYAKWDHHFNLISHDVNRFSSQEIQNLKRHQQISQSSPNQRKLNLSTKKVRYDKSLLRKSQSVDQLPSSKNLITAGKLIKSQSQQRNRYQSNTSQSSNDLLHHQINQKSFSTTNINLINSSKNKTKQIPNDFQLVLINQYDLQVTFTYFQQILSGLEIINIILTFILRSSKFNMEI